MGKPAPTILSVPAAEDRFEALVLSARALEQLVHDREGVVQDGERADSDHPADGQAVEGLHSVPYRDDVDLDS